MQNSQSLPRLRWTSVYNSVSLWLCIGCTGVATFATLHLGQVPRKPRKKAPANRPQFENSSSGAFYSYLIFIHFYTSLFSLSRQIQDRHITICRFCRCWRPKVSHLKGLDPTASWWLLILQILVSWDKRKSFYISAIHTKLFWVITSN